MMYDKVNNIYIYIYIYTYIIYIYTNYIAGLWPSAFFKRVLSTGCIAQTRPDMWTEISHSVLEWQCAQILTGHMLLMFSSNHHACMHACMETLSFEPKKLWIKYTQALSRVLLKQTRVGRCTSLSILVSYIIARNKTEKSGESASSTLFTSWILADGWISPKIQVPEAHWDEQEPTCETNYKTLW
jgi:hypothetical protein